MKPEKNQEVQAWLKKARDDLRGAQIDLEASPPLIEDALFFIVNKPAKKP
jgi:hypothetical protein